MIRSVLALTLALATTQVAPAQEPAASFRMTLPSPLLMADPASAACELPWGGTLAHGGTMEAFTASTVPYGQTCTPETRTCDDGVLSGSATEQSCEILPPDQCELTQVEGTACEDGSVYLTTRNIGGVTYRLYGAPSNQAGLHNAAATDAYVDLSFPSQSANGKNNTDMLVSLQNGSGTYSAAVSCRTRGPEWYLPATNELTLLYAKRGNLPGFQGNEYWSSTPQNPGNFAYLTTNGSVYQTNQAQPKSVRCVRREVTTP